MEEIFLKGFSFSSNIINGGGAADESDQWKGGEMVR
jgi:hypothetical protein